MQTENAVVVSFIIINRTAAGSKLKLYENNPEVGEHGIMKKYIFLS
jgi:hypothetical protein